MRIQVARILQSLSSISITAPYIMKAVHVALYLYLLLKVPLTITISIYYIICQSNTYVGTLSQRKLVQRRQPRILYEKPFVYPYFEGLKKKKRERLIFIGITNCYFAPTNQLLNDEILE